VLETDTVKNAFEKQGVVKMEADWTRSDPEITRALASFGRNSVPLYVYYPKGKGGKPVILPQLLTPGNILEVIEK
jgi:thiol:disulfide interchange protein DsbD